MYFYIILYNRGGQHRQEHRERVGRNTGTQRAGGQNYRNAESGRAEIQEHRERAGRNTGTLGAGGQQRQEHI